MDAGTSGKWKRLFLEPCGDGLGGGVALTLGGLFCWKCAGEEGVEEVAEDGLLLESSWFKVGGGSLLVIAFGKVPNCSGISTV